MGCRGHTLQLLAGGLVHRLYRFDSVRQLVFSCNYCAKFSVLDQYGTDSSSRHQQAFGRTNASGFMLRLNGFSEQRAVKQWQQQGFIIIILNIIVCQPGCYFYVLTLGGSVTAGRSHRTVMTIIERLHFVVSGLGRGRLLAGSVWFLIAISITG